MKIYCGKKEPLLPFSARVYVGNKELLPDCSRKVRLCSSLGYEWGCLTPETRQLALAVILDVTGSVRKANRLCEAFAEDVLMYLPPQWVLTEEEIATWAVKRRSVAI